MGFDLCYFLNTSVGPELKRKHLDEWLRVYCRTFSSLVDRFDPALPKPTPESVHKELVRLAPLSLRVSLCIRPIIMAPPQHYIPMSELFQNESGVDPKKRLMYATPVYTGIMKSDLPEILSVMESNDNKVNS